MEKENKMGRHPSIISSVGLNLKLPKDLRDRLNSHLCGKEKKIQKGAYQEFFVNILREFLDEADSKKLKSDDIPPEN